MLPSATATPLTNCIVIILLLVSLMLHFCPSDVGPIVAWTSTNVHNLNHHPLAAMIFSTLVVTGNPMPNVLIATVSFTVLERAIGARRTAVIALAGQVLPTLMTEYGGQLAAYWHLIAAFSLDRPDVGVSYVMYAVLFAAVMTLGRRTKAAAALFIAIVLLQALATSPGMTPTGHVLASAVGATVMAALTAPTLRRQVGAPQVASEGFPRWAARLAWCSGPALVPLVNLRRR